MRAEWIGAEGTHPGKKFREREWLHQVIIRTEFKPANAFVHCVARSEHQDGGFLAASRSAKHLPSVQTGKHHVENDQIEVQFQGQMQTFKAIRRNVDHVAGLHEALLEELGSLCFVFDYKIFIAISSDGFSATLSTKPHRPGTISRR